MRVAEMDSLGYYRLELDGVCVGSVFPEDVEKVRAYLESVQGNEEVVRLLEETGIKLDREKRRTERYEQAAIRGVLLAGMYRRLRNVMAEYGDLVIEGREGEEHDD